MEGSNVAQQFLASFEAMSGWEWLAVLLAIAYVVLAIRQRIECWYAAFGSTLIYTLLFWNVSLFMESALNVYYLLMAVYGWYQWRFHPGKDSQLTVQRWPLSRHLGIFAAIAALVFISGYLLAENTSAALPYLDSFTTWASVITTYMVAKKVLENWLYWVVIDAVSIFLYVDRGMWLTAALFVIYTLMAIIGYREWHKQLAEA